MAGFQIEDVAVDTRAAEFVRQGVADTSDSALLKFAGEQAGAAYKGFKGAQIEEAVTPEIEAFFESAAARGYEAPIYEAQTTPENLRAAQDVAAQMETGAFTAAEDPALASARGDVAKLKRAADMGAMSKGELKARIDTKLKEFINDAPGLATEFTSYVKQALGKYASNIDFIEAQRKSAASGTSDLDKYKKEQAASARVMGLPSQWVYGSEDQQKKIAGLIQQQQPLYAQSKQWEMAGKVSSQTAVMDKNQQNLLAPAYIANRITTVSVPALLGVADVSELATIRTSVAEKAKAKTTMETWAAAEKANLGRQFPLMDTARQTEYFKYIDNQVETVNGYLEGKFEADTLSNNLTSYKSGAAMRYAGTLGPIADQLTGIQQLFPRIMENTPLATAVTGEAANILAATLKETITYYKSKTSIGSMYNPQKYSQEGIDGTLDSLNAFMDGAKEKTEEEYRQFEMDSTFTILNGLDNPEVQKNISQAQYTKIFSILAKPNYAELKKKFPDEMKRVEDLTANAIDGYMGKAVNSLNIRTSKDPELLKKMYIGVDNVGNIAFVPTSAQYTGIARDYNMTYNFGTLSKAWSNVYDIPQGVLLQNLAEQGKLPPFELRAE